MRLSVEGDQLGGYLSISNFFLFISKANVYKQNVYFFFFSYLIFFFIVIIILSYSFFFFLSLIHVYVRRLLSRHQLLRSIFIVAVCKWPMCIYVYIGIKFHVVRLVSWVVYGQLERVERSDIYSYRFNGD